MTEEYYIRAPIPLDTDLGYIRGELSEGVSDAIMPQPTSQPGIKSITARVFSINLLSPYLFRLGVGLVLSTDLCIRAVHFSFFPTDTSLFQLKKCGCRISQSSRNRSWNRCSLSCSWISPDSPSFPYLGAPSASLLPRLWGNELWIQALASDLFLDPFSSLD